MRTWSRGLRDTALHVLAGLGLVLALTVMGFVFAVWAAQGDSSSHGYSLSAATSDAASVASSGAQRADLNGGSNGPSTAGVLLGVLVLGTGVTVLAIGGRRPDWDPDALNALTAE